MGLGIAKVHEHAVTHVLRHEPAKALHGLCDAFLIRRNNLAQSSGSIRAESAVEPTRSENITVTCLCSAASAAFGSTSLGKGAAVARSEIASKSRIRCPSEVTPKFLQVGVCELGEKSKINVVLGKALCVLSETERLKPVSDLLHRGRASLRRPE